MKVKVFTMTHKTCETPQDGMYIPLHVGRALSKDLGYLGDHTGDHISFKNPYYSELTGLYWIWKNVKTQDYVGLCHYRRYLINAQEQIFTEQELLQLLAEYDIITTKKLKLNVSYYDGYAVNHHQKDLEETGKVIKELFPEYYDDYERIVRDNYTYFGNIMITTKAILDEYAEWLFTVFFEVEKRIDIDSYDDYHKRVYGFISEILLLVWVTYKGYKVCECKVGMTDEKTETKQMKEQLKVYFARKDIQGAKTYFSNMLEKRPDVLMEASDINGELKIAMQVIATCDMDYQQNKTCILDKYTDFKELIAYFRQLNELVQRQKNGESLEEDQEYINNQKVSEVERKIAYMLLDKQ